MYDSGCRDIIYLARRHRERRFGKAAVRHRHHEGPELLQELASRFPELRLYTVSRDVFSATRLRRRRDDEDAFEIFGAADHVHGGTVAREGQGLIPFYTIATLHLFGDDARRPQSGFMTYFFVKDDQIALAEWTGRAHATLFSGDRPERAEILSVLRGIHYVESELPVKKGRYVAPILDPYAWISPASKGGAGEILVKNRSRRRSGSIHLSLPAVLSRVHSVLDAIDGRGRHG